MTSQQVALRTPVPPAPMLATAGPVPSGDRWVYEPKWDGCRLLLRCDAGRAELFSRHGTNLSAPFEDVAQACSAALGGRRVILDGEIVVLDRDGRPDFQKLQRRLRVSRPPRSLRASLPATVFVFDILHLDGRDLTALPYVDRRALLDDLQLGTTGCSVVMSPAWTGVDGSAVLDVMREMNLEGVVAKASMSPYQPGRRSRLWVKSVIRRSSHVLVLGYVPSGACAEAVGSLLVGGYNSAGDIVYCGHITSGFTGRARRALYARLSEIRSETVCFCISDVTAFDPRVRWVSPVVVGRAEYREFTGRLRHAVWKGVADVDPAAAELPGSR